MLVSAPAVMALLALALGKAKARDSKTKPVAEKSIKERQARKKKKKPADAVEDFARRVMARRRRAARKIVRLVYYKQATRKKLRKLQRIIAEVPITGLADAKTRLRCIELLGADAVNWGPQGEPKAKVISNGKAPGYLSALFDSKIPAPEPKPKPRAKALTAKPRRRLAAPKPRPAAPKRRAKALTTTARRRALPAPAPAPKPAPKPAAKPKPKPKPAPELSPEQKAARALIQYLDSGGTDRSQIASHQRAMTGLDPDGIPGPKTEARCASLLGKSVILKRIQPTGPAPAPDDPARAAGELADYLTIYAGKRKDRIKAYQAAMGGLVADGIAGKKTKARIRELTGRTV